MVQATLSRETSAKADRLVEMIPTLPKGTQKGTGIRFVIFPSSDDPEHIGHTATALICSCQGHKRYGMCSHRAAMIRARDRAQNELIAMAQRCSTDGCGNMRQTRNGHCFDCVGKMADRLGI
jgi:hypothetical protein